MACRPILDTTGAAVKPFVDISCVSCPMRPAHRFRDADSSPDLELALALADAADALTLARYAAVDLVVETKPDAPRSATPTGRRGSPPEAGCGQTHPDDAVLGEEEGFAGRPMPGARWVVDPIDGTKNFIRTVPVWATLLALEVDGRVEVGVVSAPALGLRWWAARGSGAWRQDARSPEPRRPRSRASRPRRRFAVLLLAVRLGGAVAAGRLPRPDPLRVADPGLRRLLVALPGRRGRRRSRLRTRGVALGPRRAAGHRRGGRRPLHGPRPGARGRTAAASCAATACCTTRPSTLLAAPPTLGQARARDPRLRPPRRPRRGRRENTLPAFREALAAGLTALESDVWLTADAVPGAGARRRPLAGRASAPHPRSARGRAARRGSPRSPTCTPSSAPTTTSAST